MSKPTPTVLAPATTTNASGLRLKTKVRAGGIDPNHGMRVKTKVRAGQFNPNHGLRVKTGVVR